MPKRDNELIVSARTVARLQRQISKRRREIKKLQADLKHERKVLRALAYAAENGAQSAPSRLTAGTTGYRLPTADKSSASTEPWNDEDANHFLDSIGIVDGPPKNKEK